MHIEIDDLTRPQIHALLEEHLKNMYEVSPPESVHALDMDKLRSPGITFWTAWEGPLLLGCGAVKELDATHGEVKSMRTPAALRRRGAGRAILVHIIETARERGYTRLSLETGSMDAFIQAQKLYESFGFTYCGPFGGYKEDPNSVFMTLHLRAALLCTSDLINFISATQGRGASSESIGPASDCLDRFTAAFNAHDLQGMDGELHFPHGMFSGAKSLSWPQAGQHQPDFFDKLRATGWDHTRYEEKVPVLAGLDKVHFRVVYTRRNKAGEVLSTHENLWIVTCVAGRWGIALRSY